MKKGLWTTGLAAFVIAAIFGGCKDENVETVGLCPLVISTNPANAANNVPLNQVITVTFNEAMNPLTITPSAFALSSPSGARIANPSRTASDIPGTLVYNDASHSMVFTPNVELKPNATYTGTVATSVKDLAGNSLQVAYVWTFSTGVAPTVLSTDPIANATGVPINKIVTATFSVPMDPLTINGTTFTVNQGATAVAGLVSYTGSTASFDPTVNLLPGTIYTATITTGAENLAGASVSNNFVWTFTTGNPTVPTVLSTDPLDLATGVALNKVIGATFSEAMNPLTISGTTFTLMQGATPVTGVVNYSGTTATFTPTSNLLSGSSYTATVTTGAQSLSGASLASNHVWSFNTAATLGPLAVNLGTVARFGIIAGVGVTNNAGPSQINDLDVGIYPGARSSITGFFVVDGGPGLINNGAFFASDDLAPPGTNAMLNQAQLDLVAAYNEAAGATTPAPNVAPADLGGQTLAPGIWTSASTMLLQNGNLTLDAQGDANAVWIFQVGAGFTSVGSGPFPSASGGNVILAGGAQAKNVFWQVGSSAIIGDFTSFKGTILAFSSITMNSGAVAEGRMLARNASVTMTSTNIINKP